MLLLLPRFCAYFSLQTLKNYFSGELRHLAPGWLRPDPEARVPTPLLRHWVGRVKTMYDLTNCLYCRPVFFVVSDIINLRTSYCKLYSVKPLVLSAFDERPGSQYIRVLLQYVLLCFIYFSKVEIAEFLRLFRSLNIRYIIWLE